MNTGGFELRTERLLLRPHRLEDVDDVFEFARDPDWARYLTVPTPYVREHAVEFVARRILASWDEYPAWAMVLEGKVVGAVGIRIDREHAKGELGYSLAKEHWGHGLTVEASRAAIDWGFRERELARVYAYADARNTPSQRVMEKLGMTREGTLRSHQKHREERIDTVYYGLLREEWETDAD